MPDKDLELVFATADGTKKIITITDPKEGLDNGTVTTAMQSIITANVFKTTAGDLAEAVEARYRTVSVEVIE